MTLIPFNALVSSDFPTIINFLKLSMNDIDCKILNNFVPFLFEYYVYRLPIKVIRIIKIRKHNIIQNPDGRGISEISAGKFTLIYPSRPGGRDPFKASSIYKSKTVQSSLCAHSFGAQTPIAPIDYLDVFSYRFKRA